ncbi:MAG: hypothetical protein QGH42_12300 [Kiritimatiellia bacterium]|jgi:hypothetical protein|nr:hypothetical protein [Kiritimatiellia bacterium]MDP6631770.1 hypothetical protein [Kiritimatiellia bacterium]MDP6810476.1 hypothetical protein [Kiritimatiellia bacterium]MDP7025006.1 hypothetical protein [Kiritimatiellia bacterium]
MRLKTVLKQGFHGSEDAGIGMGSQDRAGITLVPNDCRADSTSGSATTSSPQSTSNLAERLII